MLFKNIFYIRFGINLKSTILTDNILKHDSAEATVPCISSNRITLMI